MKMRILGLLIIFPTLIYAGSELYHWDECTHLLAEIRNCTSLLHIPESCHEKSELLRCAGNVLKNIRSCKDPLAVRMLKHYVTTYENSDQVVCEENMREEFLDNPKCLQVTSNIAGRLASATPGTLSEKGCRYLYSALYIRAVTRIRAGCFDLLEKYIAALYNKSFCSKVKVEAPTYSQMKTLSSIGRNIILCWIQHTGLPTCRDSPSNRMDCISSLDVKTDNENFKPLITNLIDVSNYTDRVICNNTQLKTDFQEKLDCWNSVRYIGALILGQANGLLTEEGCRVVQYTENITMARFDQHCVKLLLDYRKSMDQVLPCWPTSPLSSANADYGENAVAMTVLLLFILKMIENCI